MARNSNRGRGSHNADFGVMEMARERPFAAAATAAGAAAAGLFLWSKRTQISDQLSHLNHQIGEWKEGFRSSEAGDEFAATGQASRSATRSASRRGVSKTGGGNANLGRRSGGGGIRSTASGRSRARSQPTI